MKFAPSLVMAGIAAVSLNGFASDWGLVKGTYNVGSSQLVTKDIGSLEINLSLNCIEKAADVTAGINELVDRFNQEIKRESNYSMNSLTPEVSVYSQNRFDMKYDEKDAQQLSPYYVDTCNGNSPIKIGATSIDLTKKVFMANATLKLEGKGSLSGLTVLRQKLQQFAEALNKEDTKKQAVVNRELLVVSAEKKQETVAILNDQNRLTGARQSRIKLDEALGGGFSELFITSVATSVDQYLEYNQYSPVLTESGKSKVTVPYTFSVQYNPENIANTQNRPWTGADHGTLTQVIEGVAEVDTDYYMARLNLRTTCQPSKTAASTALNSAFANFKKMAQSVVRPIQNNPYERLEETVGVATLDDQWQGWEREVVADKTGRESKLVVKSYISLCDGRVLNKIDDSDRTYAASYSLTLVTKNFAGLKKLAHAANAFTEGQRVAAGSKRVEVELGNIVPRLKDAKQFEVVDVLTYASALEQLADPQGEVAKKLLDEIHAGEAYYTATRGYGPRALAAAAPAARSSGGAPGGAPSYDVVTTSDENIPMTEIKLNNVYNVVYRPNKDLVKVLKEARSAQAPKMNRP